MAPINADIIIELDNRLPATATCKRCGQTFHKNRRDKLYCSPGCQSRFYNIQNLKVLKKVNRDLVALDDRPSMAELTRAFELATGVPFAVRMKIGRAHV